MFSQKQKNTNKNAKTFLYCWFYVSVGLITVFFLLMMITFAYCFTLNTHFDTCFQTTQRILFFTGGRRMWEKWENQLFDDWNIMSFKKVFIDVISSLIFFSSIVWNLRNKVFAKIDYRIRVKNFNTKHESTIFSYIK